MCAASARRTPERPGSGAASGGRDAAWTVGIDLGTTHTVVACASARDAAAGSDAIRLFDIDQLVAPGEVAARPLLPSMRYHPAPGELASGDLTLPWMTAAAVGPGDGAAAGSDPVAPSVIGHLARQLGARVPGRLVTSAKSWLSHGAVDRLAPILPWGAADDVPRVSPVQASASYLAHLRAAWNHRHPDAPLEDQEVVLTVPASFDDAARALTVAAARDAGLPRLRLLEEPQAALYDWLFRHRDTLSAALAGARLVLVCDVGGHRQR
ncbi:MAG: Hsp70 family protein, partial [Variovorax sp.]